MEILMERTVTKQVRLTVAEAKKLAQLAKALGKSESDILRMGLEDAEAGLRRLEARRKNWHLLVQMAKDVPGPTGPPGRLGFR